MSERPILELLAGVDAIVTDDHLVYTSGRHGSTYVNKDALYPHTAAISAVCERIAAEFAAADVDVVAGPTVGGVIMAQWTADHLGRRYNREVLAVYAEEEGTGESRRRLFRRGYDALVAGRRVLVVEDILTTGLSARLVVEAVGAAGGSVVGVGALCNRGDVTAGDLGAPALFALTSIPMVTYAPEGCPLCQAGVPVNTRLGKGAAFLRAKGEL